MFMTASEIERRAYITGNVNLAAATHLARIAGYLGSTGVYVPSLAWVEGKGPPPVGASARLLLADEERVRARA